MSVCDALRRSSRSGAYSSDSYQPRAAAMSGNSMMTTRMGAASPSSTSTAPPRATNRPPWFATASVLRSRYSTSFSWSQASFTPAMT